MPALAAPLEDVAAQLQAVRTDADALTAGLDEAALNWQASPGRSWSVGQCLDHLRVTNLVYLAALREGLRGARRSPDAAGAPIRPGLPSRLFLRSLEPPPRMRVPAPRKIVPASRVSADVLAAFQGAHDEVRALLDECADVDLNRARFPNPFVPGVRLTIGTGLLIVPAHERRHLWQARRVRDALLARG